MTIKEIIETGISGGWKFREIEIIRVEVFSMGVPFARLFWRGDQYSENGEEYTDVPLEVIFLDPEFFKAVGREMGWNKNKTFDSNDKLITWRRKMHQMLSAIIEGNKKGTSVTESIIKWVGSL